MKLGGGYTLLSTDRLSDQGCVTQHSRATRGEQPHGEDKSVSKPAVGTGRWEAPSAAPPAGAGFVASGWERGW